MAHDEYGAQPILDLLRLPGQTDADLLSEKVLEYCAPHPGQALRLLIILCSEAGYETRRQADQIAKDGNYDPNFEIRMDDAGMGGPRVEMSGERVVDAKQFVLHVSEHFANGEPVSGVHHLIDVFTEHHDAGADSLVSAIVSAACVTYRAAYREAPKVLGFAEDGIHVIRDSKIEP